MRVSQLTAGKRYGMQVMAMRDRHPSENFDHVELMVKNARSIAQLEAAGYTIRLHNAGQYDAAHSAAEKARTEAAQERGLTVLPGSLLIKDPDKLTFAPKQLVRIIASTHVNAGKIYTDKRKQGSSMLIPAERLLDDLDTLLTGAQELAKSQQAQSDQYSAQSAQKAADKQEMLDLLAARGLLGKELIKDQYGHDPAVKLTLAELKQLLA